MQPRSGAVEIIPSSEGNALEPATGHAVSFLRTICRQQGYALVSGVHTRRRGGLYLGFIRWVRGLGVGRHKAVAKKPKCADAEESLKMSCALGSYYSKIRLVLRLVASRGSISFPATCFPLGKILPTER